RQRRLPGRLRPGVQGGRAAERLYRAGAACAPARGQGTTRRLTADCRRSASETGPTSARFQYVLRGLKVGIADSLYIASLVREFCSAKLPAFAAAVHFRKPGFRGGNLAPARN